ncbi:FAD dependent dehydrogenase [Alkaliphilus metalliredigens QYMF]|uniref:FAD dependent dehydrogenase n=1 Tax=Alkaliphilus metalliredigens (strain QYMF) TaxID=293826 RepID=A6TLS9_ALKMQ|nr:NAD(P)-binding protein [Alkaliphilus metalliredigens]ABR47147.1 FAD dependent dehydrogenase [Alkaliphilus metalliredigens QYMF]
MKVAIMGAGLSGLSCAITLEQHGIYPDIYENRRCVGDRFINGEIVLDILNRPIQDSVAYLSEKHHVFLQPTANIKKLVLISEKSRATIEGNLGFSSIRGRHPLAWESQLSKQVTSNFFFNSDSTYEDLLATYSHVIMSPGDGSYPMKLGNYRQDLTVRLKGSIYRGSFDVNTVYAWLNHDVAPKGYAYLIPLSHEEANATIAFPNYPENEVQDLDQLWERFQKLLQKEGFSSLTPVDEFNVTNYIIGRSEHGRIGNTFFTGNCFCSLMPFLGFGQFSSLLTGIYAAQDLAGMGQYEKLSHHLIKSYESSLVLRRALEKMSNQDYDYFVGALNNQLGNKLFTTQINLLQHLSTILKPWIRLTTPK